MDRQPNDDPIEVSEHRPPWRLDTSAADTSASSVAEPRAIIPAEGGSNDLGNGPDPTAYDHARRSHAGCMVCGNAGSVGASLGLRFVSTEAGGVRASFKTLGRYQGYDGVLHGGMIATLLDAAMVHCLFAHGVTALTAEMTVRFLRQVPIDRDIDIDAVLIGERHGLFQLTASLALGGTVLAKATGKFREARRVTARPAT